MFKRTLFFQSPGHVSLALRQLCFQDKQGNKKTVPIEDVGMVIFESLALTVTSALLEELTANNVCAVFCNAQHLPDGILLPLAGNSLSQKVIASQIEATEALKGRLWRQTVVAKLHNQAQCLKRGGKDGCSFLMKLKAKVRSADPENVEATGARFYFKQHAPNEDFIRDPDGDMPNASLNYGYAILRAAMARALVASGMLTIIGIHHHGQYNAHCLADDVMEPYRPFVDDAVFNLPDAEIFSGEELTLPMKQKLLSVLAADVKIGNTVRPLMSALSMTTASLARCFQKEDSEIIYPEFSE